MADNVVGSVVGKIRFSIDKKSWDNLALFQSKLTSIKRQMTSMDKSIKVNAVVSQINKVANATVNAEKKVAATTQKYSGNVRTSNKNADMNGRLAHLFPATALSSPASRTMFAQMLRDEDKAAANLIKQKDKHDAQQAKQTAKANRNRTAFEAGVANFMLIKESQLNQYADRVRMGREQRAEMMGRLGAAKESALKGIDPTQARAIESFRAQVNKTKNEMVNFDRITRANAVSFRSLRNEVVQLTAAYTAFSVVQNVAQTGMEMEGLRAAARVFAGDDAGVANHMKFISDEANRLGTNLMTATKEFTKFSIATKGMVSTEGGRQIFSGVSEYASILQIDQQQYERAFRSINQMLSKGQLMAEEVRSQLGESLYGAIPILAEAYGFSKDQKGQAAFFKAMEMGQLKATEDKFVAFAKGLSDVANANGALEAVTKKTRAEMERFFAQLTHAKDAIFQGGMNEGLSYMFGSFAELLKEMEPVASAFGAAFRGAVVTLTGAIKVALIPFRGLVALFDSLGNNLERLGILDGSGGIWSLVGGAGVLALMATRFSWLSKAIISVNTALLTMAARFAPIIAAYAVLEDLALYATYGDKADTVIGRSKQALQARDMTSVGGFFQSTWQGYKEYSPLGMLINIKVDDSEFGKAINAEVSNINQSRNAINQTETSQ